MNVTTASGGLSEQTFLQQIRDDLEDPAVFRGTEVLSGNGSSTVYQVPTFPIYDGDAYGGAFWNIKAGASGATAQTLADTKNALSGANNVYVDYQTGICIWATAPSSGTNNVKFTHSSVRWTDRRMLRAVNNGLKAMFPTVWQYGLDTSMTVQVNTYDYTLPSVFYDPRVRIFQVEVQEIPSTVEPFMTIGSWRRVGNSTLHIPNSQKWSPGAVIRVHYTGPYTSVAELEPQVQNLPLLYAKGILLLDKEAVRARADQASVVQSEGANPAGTQANAGVALLRQFENELARLKRVIPPPPLRSAYMG